MHFRTLRHGDPAAARVRARPWAERAPEWNIRPCGTRLSAVEGLEPGTSDLEARIAAATSLDTVRGVIFNSTFALLSEAAGKPAAVECDPVRRGHRNEFFSYPVTEYLRLAWRAADLLAVRYGGREHALWQMGAGASRRWLGGPLGSTLVAFTGRDPRRLLTNVASGYRNVVSYGARSIEEWLGERHARLLFRHDFLVPPFHCGALTAALEVTCGIPFRAEGRQIGFLDSEYDVTW
ncbi:MAG TPA: TIGR02265 family protein [Anaeromyxobacter sp.]